MASDTATNAARKAALDALQPVASDPSIRPIILALGPTGEGEDPDTTLEKALQGISTARSALIKDDGVSPKRAFQVGQKLAEAEAALQREYMTRHSVGFRKAEAANRESERLRARQFGGAA